MKCLIDFSDLSMAENQVLLHKDSSASIVQYKNTDDVISEAF